MCVKFCLTAFQPTAKFFGKDGIRKTIILEGGDARLPLRLTGDGVSCYCDLFTLSANTKVAAMESQIQIGRPSRQRYIN